MKAWRALLRAHAELMGRLDRELATAHDLSLAEYEVLACLADAKDQRLRASDLAQSLTVSKSAVTRRLDLMVRRGWVRREACAEDRRGVYAVLTPQGLARLQLAAPSHVAGVRRHFLARLGPRRLTALSGALDRVPGE